MMNNSKRDRLTCTRPWTSFLIHDHKGNVNPCCWSLIDTFGNVNISTIDEIWNGPAYKLARELISKGDLDTLCSIDCPIRLGEYDETLPLPTNKICLFNFNLQNEEIKNHAITLESKPTRMRIVPTVECNLNCVMCYQDHSESVELPTNIKDTLASYFPYLQELLILGGEPLISHECLSIIEMIDSSTYPDLHLALITNGSAITKRVENLLSSKLISWILVSVDAASEETYKMIRRGKYSAVINGIRKLKAIKDRQFNNWKLLAGFTFMPSNMREVLEFVDLTKSLGVDCVFTPVFGDWHAESFSSFSREELDRAKQIVLDLEHYLETQKIGKIKAQRLRILLQMD